MAVVPACASQAPPAPVAPAPAVAAAPAPAPTPAAPLDEGKFMVRVGGKPAGEETFVIRPQGEQRVLSFHGALDMGVVQLDSKGTLTFERSQRPVSAEGVTQAGTEIVAWRLGKRDGAFELVIEPRGSAPITQKQTREVDVLIPTGAISPVAALCALARPVPVQASAFPGMTVSLQGAVKRPFAAPGGGERLLDHVVADIGGAVRIDLLCDGTKLLAMRQPITAMTAARAGEEALALALEAGDRAKPPTPDGLVELPRTVDSTDGAKLACTLTVPKSHAEVKKRARTGTTAALPAVVFITGSGPQDRDEDSIGPGGLKLSIFKVLATALAEAQVASLRCDDRGTGASTGDFGKATLETFVADTTAAVAAVRAEPALDPARVGLVGHSEGGIVAPIVAGRDGKLRAVVLMAGTGRPIDVILEEQAVAGLERAGADALTRKRELDSARAIHAALRDGKPLPAELSAEEKAALERAAPWLQSHLRHDPVAAAAKLKRVPVLVAQGDADKQVAVKDAEILRDTLTKAGNKQLTFKIYKGLNHLFAPTRTGSLADYSDPDARVDATFIADVVTFCRSALKVRGATR